MMSRIPRVRIRKSYTTATPTALKLSTEDTISLTLITDITGRELLLDRQGATARAGARVLKMLHDQLALVEVEDSRIIPVKDR